MTISPGGSCSKRNLLRLGFLEAEIGSQRLATLGPCSNSLVSMLAATADPDGALDGLMRLIEATSDAQDLIDTLDRDEGSAMRLLTVLGASEALTDHLAQHPDHWHELTDPLLGSTRPAAYAVRAGLLECVGASATDAEPVATLPDEECLDALRVEYRRVLLRLAARDLAHDMRIDDVAAELAELADGTLEAALAVARQRVGEQAHQTRLSVIAMGKCGGHELNYVSDVDVIFVHAVPHGTDPEDHAAEQSANRIATQLAGHLIRICSDHTGEGTIWPVDAGLRPEGSQGPLTRTLASHRGYYDRWAKTWEFQALLKARPVAGDKALGAEYVEMVSPMIWSAAERDGFVADAQAMRRRVVEHIPAREADRQLKLGSGGLRDVEFAVQLLQLVHGRADDRIRAPTTLSALDQLTEAGYVGREDGEALHEAYSFLRTLEHRIQLHRLRRIHVVPEDEESLRRLGRNLGYFKDPIGSFDKAWRYHRREVRRLHEKLFYRPLLAAVAKIPGEEARLSSEAARDRLHALGYADAGAALRNLEALTTGVSRTATVQRALLPAMLEWFAEGPDPDAGLFGFRRISEALGRTPWYLKTLRDEGAVAQRLAQLLSTSRYATSLLEREPQGVRILGGELSPPDGAALTEEMRSTGRRQDSAEKSVRALRAVRRRELLRLASGEVLGLIDVADVGAGLSRLTDATLEATLEVVTTRVLKERKLDEAPTRIAIIAMGRYGGFELSYGSDADVLFVHDPVPGSDPTAASSFAQAVANELRNMLAVPGDDPALEVDAGLRPEGKQGPLVRTIDSYAAYYAKWSKVWEAQALLRADAVVGDLELRERFTALIDPLRYPVDGLSEDDIIEVRRIKARVEEERLPRGADRQAHLKLGHGGLADIEWTVQLLQMRHAGQVEGLRTPRTLDALAAAAAAGLLAAEDAETLAVGWRTVSRVRNAVTLARGKPSDSLPRDARERASVANILGYPPAHTDAMVNDFLRTMRVSRTVVERVFWE